MAEKKKKIKVLETETEEPDFWQDQEKASKISQELADLKEEINFWENLKKEVEDLLALAEITEEGDESLQKEIKEKYRDLKKRFEKERIKTFLNGPYDRRNAILTIYAGAGGTEAQDWTEMLLKMYLKYAEKKGWEAKVLEIHPGQEAGLKQVTFLVKGPYAYGYLKGEQGVHRLVRLSPFNAKNLRHTSFALVEVLPEFDRIPEIKIRPEDLKIETFRASGPGGQYVNKTESAVRITHLPTGITVACQSSRLQGENKERAMKLLYSKLYQYLEKKREKEKESLRGGRVAPEWGNQIRSYVLHPYKLVKDLRTGAESTQPEEVLEGELDPFIEAEILKRVQGKGSGMSV